MAKQKIIKVTVYYDEAHHVPTDEALLKSLGGSIGDGLLSPDNDEVVEECRVEIE